MRIRLLTLQDVNKNVYKVKKRNFRFQCLTIRLGLHLGRTGNMQARRLSLIIAALALIKDITAAQDGASRKLLQMDLAGLLGGGGTFPFPSLVANSNFRDVQSGYRWK
jgi:hypothetical protein